MEVNVYGDVYVYKNEEDGKPHERKTSSIRSSPALSTAKKQVKERDQVCQCCGEIGVNGHLEVHHILPLAKYKSLATDEHNLIALCQSCHHKYHEQYEGCEGADTFSKWLSDNRRVF